ncbi:MAG: hypothetical protein L0F96_02530 [Lactococcus lactis]|nr:hypothetical protein [Lactococcus lactis]MDN5446594.1 hypothetical protein [Lactococcus lactis]MDN5473937.1 hypothetical protein [Lactococcus lactis]
MIQHELTEMQCKILANLQNGGRILDTSRELADKYDTSVKQLISEIKQLDAYGLVSFCKAGESVLLNITDLGQEQRIFLAGYFLERVSSYE